MRNRGGVLTGALLFFELALMGASSSAHAQAFHAPVLARPYGLKTYGGGARGGPTLVAAGVCLLVGVPSFAIGLGVGLASQPYNTPALVAGGLGGGLTVVGVSLGLAGLARQWSGGISRNAPARYGIPLIAWQTTPGAESELTLGWAGTF